MSGASNFALIVMSIGCVTLGLPLERKQVTFEPQLTYEIIKQGPPCETTAKIGDDVKLALSSFKEVGDDVERYSFLFRCGLYRGKIYSQYER